jgi:hypothetical protein
MAIHSDLYLGSDYELYNAFEKTSFHTGVGTIDVPGVALKGVQALIEKVEDLKTVNSNYQNQLEQQQQMIQTLLSRIEALENQ